MKNSTHGVKPAVIGSLPRLIEILTVLGGGIYFYQKLKMAKMFLSCCSYLFDFSLSTSKKKKGLVFFDPLQLRTKKGPIGPPAELHEEERAAMKPCKSVVRCKL